MLSVSVNTLACRISQARARGRSMAKGVSVRQRAAQRRLGRRTGKNRTTHAAVPALEECYPASTKEHDIVAFNGHALHVPKRRVHLQEGAPSPGFVDLYDTSGPQGFAGKDGIPQLRASWLSSAPEGTQMTRAKAGELTPEMIFAAKREVCCCPTRSFLPPCFTEPAATMIIAISCCCQDISTILLYSPSHFWNSRDGAFEKIM